MEFGIPTLEYISLVKCAVLISLSKKLKREILCVSGSDYDSYNVKYQYYRKYHWNEIVATKAKEILNHIQLPENSQEKVLSILTAVGLRMLSWAEYHEGTLGLTRNYSLNFLRNCHFTFQGLIDNKKAAEEMVKDINLSIRQRYKLACIYCLESQIFNNFKEMIEYENILTDSTDSRWMHKPEIVKYWTYHLTNVVHLEAGYTTQYLCMLETSIKSGSKQAVKYSLEKRCLHFRENALIWCVKKVLDMISPQKDWIVFRDQRFDDSKESWAPNYFYLDILCFLLSNMTKDQQKKALEENINGYHAYTGRYARNTVLEMLLFWPYQDYFMKIAAVVWDLIPQERYPYILYSMVQNISEVNFTYENFHIISILYGEEKSYDYKKLLKDFWSESPDHLKRIVFTNIEEAYGNDANVTFRPRATNLVYALITVKKFTDKDVEIIRLILSSATLAEKTLLTSAEWWKSATMRMLKKEKFEFFDHLVSVLCTSDKEAREFKNKLDFFNIARSVVDYFLKYSKINAVKSLIQRMSLSGGKLLSVKYDIIFSSDGMQYCSKLLSSGKYKEFEECIKWFLPSKDKRIKYKKELALNIKKNPHADRFPVHKFSEIDTHIFMTSFTRSKLPNREAVMGIQTSVADIFGLKICEDLIAGSSFQVIYKQKNSLLRVNTEFTGGQWERVDEFLRWSLCTEEKILQFKKHIFEVSGDDIHFQLIKAKKWEEAKTFFDWLGLSHDEIKYLKKRTILNQGWMMLHFLVFGEDEINNLETIDLFLRWNLTDKKCVIEFSDTFFKAHDEIYDESRLLIFCKIVGKYLNDLDQDESYTRWNPEEVFLMKLKTASSKRKSTVLFPQKKDSSFSTRDV